MRKKHYFGRAIVFVICAVFAVAFLLPSVLTITNSFMSESEINSNYGMIVHRQPNEKQVGNFRR